MKHVLRWRSLNLTGKDPSNSQTHCDELLQIKSRDIYRQDSWALQIQLNENNSRQFKKLLNGTFSWEIFSHQKRRESSFCEKFNMVHEGGLP